MAYWWEVSSGQYWEGEARPGAVSAIEVPTPQPTRNHFWNTGTNQWEIDPAVEEELKWKQAGQYFIPSQLIRAFEILINSVEALSLSNPLPGSFNALKNKLAQLKADVGL